MPKKFTQEEVEKYYFDNGYELLSKYKGANNKNTIRSIETGKVYEQTLSKFKEGCRPEKRRVKLSQKEVEKYYLDNGYKLLSEYKNGKVKNKIMNINTGEVYYQCFSNFKSGQRPDKLNLKKYGEVKKLVSKTGYTLVEYKRMYLKAKFKCPMGHLFYKRPKDFLNRYQRCPHCSTGESNGETLIRNILETNQIDYNQEFTVIINGDTHRVDFEFSVNNKIYFIEYQGEQHYKPIESFGGLSSYKDRVIRDADKINYCENNHIKLIAIPYTYNSPKNLVNYINNNSSLGIKYYKDYNYMDKYLYNEVADYYNKHTLQETVKRFGLSARTITKYYSSVYKHSKTNGVDKKLVSSYYITNSGIITSAKFKVDAYTVRKYFKQVYGMTKRQYLKQHPELKSWQFTSNNL